MNRAFDFYEYAGVIVPGAVLIIGLLWLFPDGRALLSKDGITLGEFALFGIVAYAVGQLVQAIGNGIEWAWWKAWGGMPSAQVLAGKRVSKDQHQRIVGALRAKGLTTAQDVTSLPLSERQTIVREVYAVVADAKRGGRVDTFNGNYGLMRGLAAAILVLLIAAIATAKGLLAAVALGAALLLALQRMHRFGKHYAIDLFVQFLGASGKAEQGDRPG